VLAEATVEEQVKSLEMQAHLGWQLAQTKKPMTYPDYLRSLGFKSERGFSVKREKKKAAENVNKALAAFSKGALNA
jgi:sulfur carrier protein ThiS